MIKVITYGTFDLLHYGHIRLLERAKKLGDYLVVGVTSDDFDKTRGKINVKQTLMERIEALRETGLADEIIVEEYRGQKIDDIKKMGIDIFAIGSDWEGYFDYLKEFCKVVYLDRTIGISSTALREKERAINLGIVGNVPYLNRFYKEVAYVNGLNVTGVCAEDFSDLDEEICNLEIVTSNYEYLLDHVDAVYIMTHPSKHYEQIKMALNKGVHILCESPITLRHDHYKELLELAEEKNCVLTEAIRTAYSTAFHRLVVLVQSGAIGDVVSVDSTCTSLRNFTHNEDDRILKNWGSFYSWGPTALLPVFYLLGSGYKDKNIISMIYDEDYTYDVFTKIDFIYDNAVASIKVGKGVKSEGEMIISGTKGYVFVPSPWWKTDYFEIRYERSEDNKRYFYQLDGEGIRYELVAFVKEIQKHNTNPYIDSDISEAIVKVMENFNDYDSRILLNTKQERIRL